MLSALIANLAHDDAVGMVAECCGQKLARCDGDLAGNLFNILPTNRDEM
jgi:hypothetical protein